MKPIFLLFEENSGSSWICDLLGAAPEIAHIDFEPLCALILANYPLNKVLEYLQSLMPAVKYEDYKNVRRSVGWPELDDCQIDKIRIASYFLIKFRSNEFPFELISSPISKVTPLIRLIRSDFAKQSVSIYKRRVLGVSHFENFEVTDPIKIEREGFFRIMSELQLAIDNNDYFYSQWPGKKICINYENFLKNISAELFFLGEFLQCEIRSSDSYYKKITHDDLELAVVNYKCVSKWVNEFVNSGNLN